MPLIREFRNTGGKKLIELQGKMDKSTVIIGKFNTPLSTIDRTNQQKISKHIENLKNTIKRTDLINIYRT